MLIPSTVHEEAEKLADPEEEGLTLEDYDDDSFVDLIIISDQSHSKDTVSLTVDDGWTVVKSRHAR